MIGEGCEIYIDGASDRECLAKIVMSVTRGEIDKFMTITNDIMEIDVCLNDDHDSERKRETDGFVYFPYMLDIVLNVDLSNEIISLIGRLLSKLWETGFTAVAACEFENDLPFNGRNDR